MEAHGLGDPTAVGWSAFSIYFIATWLCYRAGSGLDRRDPLTSFWLGLSFSLFSLGVNKQLDFQVWLGIGGRWITKSLGWYDQRVWIQLGFATTVSLILLASTALLIRLSWGHLQRIRLTVGGIALLASFVLLRVVTFDLVEYELMVAALHAHELLEITAGLMICVGAVTFARTERVDLRS